MRAVSTADPVAVLRAVAASFVLPLSLAALVAALWGVGAPQVVAAAYASAADPLELPW
jgi:hypothetical protein